MIGANQGGKDFFEIQSKKIHAYDNYFIEHEKRTAKIVDIDTLKKQVFGSQSIARFYR